jgi:adenine/guanine phosphoribosyltransferase-like PRPP-binding protein
VSRGKGVLAGVTFLVELTFLGGRERLRAAGVDEAQVRSLIGFGEGE